MNLYIRVKMTKPTTCERTPDAMPRPWTMKYGMKKLEALGRFSDNTVVTLPGFSVIFFATAVAAEVIVVIRKT